MKNDAAVARANSLFKKEQQAREGEAAWKDYEDKRTADHANMLRLRKLRLAREAKTAAKPPAGKQATKKAV